MIVQMQSVNFEFSENEQFSTKLFRFDVKEGTNKLSLRFVYKNVGIVKNELKVLVYDSCGEFRGWMSQEKRELLIAIKEASVNGIKGYIPSGEWMILIESGTILHALRYTVEISPQVGEIHKNWYTGELHSHTTRSDGTMCLSELINEAKKHKLDFLFVTDHDMPLRRNNELDSDLKVFPGVEITSYKGHALALGIERHINPQLMAENLELSSKLVRNDGGVFGIAHPFFPPSPYCSGCKWSYKLSPASIDFLELWNSGGTASFFPGFNLATLSLWVGFLNKGLKICATSGGDIHNDKDFNDLWLPYHVRATELSLKSIICSIKTGKGYASKENFYFEVLYKDKKYYCGDTINVAKDDFVEVMASSEAADKTLLLTSAGVMNFDTSSFNKKFRARDVKWLSILFLHRETIVGFSNPVFLRILGNSNAQVEEQK